MDSKNIYYYIFTFSLFLSIAAPQLFSDGMFMDGLYYATIAHNLSNGFFTMWHLNFSPSFDIEFYGHPPLQIWIQSLLFKYIADSIYIERIYSLFTYLISGFLIYKLWINMAKPEYKKLAWLPLFLWVITPLSTWAVANNLLENTLQIFVLAAALHIFKSTKEKLILHSILAGVFLFFGFLSKGFVIVFPIVLPFLFLLFYSDYKFNKFITQIVILILSISVLVFLMVFIFPESKIYFEKYFHEQIINSIKLKSGYHGRFFIVNEFFNQILPSLAFLLLSIIYLKIKKASFNFDKNLSNLVYILLILILSGFLPFLLSIKQRGFYLIPVLPFIALLISLILAKQLNQFKWINKLPQHNIFKTFSLSLLAISLLISIFFVGKIGREKEKITDVYKICNFVPANSIIKVSENSLRKDYALMGYFSRTKRIGLLKTNKSTKYYFLTNKNYNKIPKAYTKKDLKLEKYCLYIKVK